MEVTDKEELSLERSGAGERPSAFALHSESAGAGFDIRSQPPPPEILPIGRAKAWLSSNRQCSLVLLVATLLFDGL
jgi:hypothetical protein